MGDLSSWLSPAILLMIGGICEALRRHLREEKQHQAEYTNDRKAAKEAMLVLERRIKAHTVAMGKRLDPPLSYEEIRAAERQANLKNGD